MARTESRTKTAIWTDPDFRLLSRAAQRFYWLLYSQSTISLCGVVAYTPKRWAGYASDETLGTIEAALDELEHARYVVVDRDTEEVWVRTFVRHDGVAKSPKTLGAAREQAEHILSTTIRPGVYAALDPSGNTLSDSLSDSLYPGRQNGVSDRPRTRACADSDSDSDSDRDVADLALDAQRLCDLLADCVQAQRRNRPKVTAVWLRDMSTFIRLGPAGVDKPTNWTPTRIEKGIRRIFSELTEPAGSSDFCWANQVRSPRALRKHWESIAVMFTSANGNGHAKGWTTHDGQVVEQ